MIKSNGSIKRTATCVGAQRLVRDESHLPFFLLSRLRKVSYLAVSVRLTVKQVEVNECVVQYDWSMIFKGPIKQANSENCGPPRGNKFDLEKGQRSSSRSRHGTIRKGLSQGPCMPNMNALSLILQKI